MSRKRKSKYLILISEEGIDYEMRRRKIELAREGNVRVLTELSSDSDYLVRCSIARNINTPPKVLERLSRDPNVEVRKNLVENMNVTEKILKKLAFDEDVTVMLGVLRNVNCTSAVCKALWKGALKRKELRPECDISYVVYEIVKHRLTGRDVLRDIARKKPSGDVKYLGFLAQRDDISEKTLELLVDDTPNSVLWSRNCTRRLVGKVARNHFQELFEMFKMNSAPVCGYPQKVFRKVVERYLNQAWRSEFDKLEVYMKTTSEKLLMSLKGLPFESIVGLIRKVDRPDVLLSMPEARNARRMLMWDDDRRIADAAMNSESAEAKALSSTL